MATVSSGNLTDTIQSNTGRTKYLKYSANPFKLNLIMFDLKHKHGKEVFKTEFNFSDFVNQGLKPNLAAPPFTKKSDCRFVFNLSVVPSKAQNDDISTISMN